jgi:hypothetical protein
MKHPKNSAAEMKKNPGETINKTNPLADKGMTKKRDSNLSADPQGLKKRPSYNNPTLQSTAIRIH